MEMDGGNFCISNLSWPGVRMGISEGNLPAFLYDSTVEGSLFSSSRSSSIEKGASGMELQTLFTGWWHAFQACISDIGGNASWFEEALHTRAPFLQIAGNATQTMKGLLSRTGVQSRELGRSTIYSLVSSSNLLFRCHVTLID